MKTGTTNTIAAALAVMFIAQGATPAPVAEKTADQAAARLPALPTLFLIGDSTVKNGRDNGAGGLWGWGNPIADCFDKTRIHVDNSALGGTSSRSFQTTGLWDKVLARLKPGDFVIMQFGHDDGGSPGDSRRRIRSRAMAKKPRKSLLRARRRRKLSIPTAGLRQVRRRHQGQGRDSHRLLSHTPQ